MRTNRENLLGVLQSISPGLAPKESIQQGTCFVFKDKKVRTFNDEIACLRDSPIDITCAVTAKPLIDLLSRLEEDEIDILIENGEFQVRGKGRRCGVRMDAAITLPVVSEVPETWTALDPNFCEAVSVAYPCASTDESKFTLTCVHIHPDWVEGCDQTQLARYPIKTGVTEPTLIRASAASKIVPCGVSEVAVTKSWIHFRNTSGLLISCRRFMDEYFDLTQFLARGELEKVVLPGGLEEMVAKAEIFSGDSSVGNHVIVSIGSDIISIRGEGANGWFEERKSVVYHGKPIKFLVAPKLILAVSKKSNECYIDGKRLFLDTGKFSFVTSTVQPKAAEAV